ncbi:MAG: ABC transporter permease [Nitrospirae bacterium]|nr:ABC transporter permease [Nitrospirota bacterium]
METLLSGFSQAIRLIFSFDRELYSIIFLSLKVSGSALFLATIIGLPIGSLIGLKRFFGRDFIISLLNTFMGLPPVVVGLLLYLIFSRSGPLGFMSLLYTPAAMIIAQTLLAAPIVAALSHSSIIGVDDIIKKSAITLGATPAQAAVKVIVEARYGIMAAIIAGFGRVIAEVGAILIVGGNIAGYTRVMTTTIALETDKGNFELAIALGVVLISISLCINIILHLAQKKGIVK